MRSLTAIAALAVLTPLIASCAATTADGSRAGAGDAAASDMTGASEPGERQCFRARQVNGYRSVEDADGRSSDHRVLVDVGAADTYELTFFGDCPGIRTARGIAFRETGVGRICDGLDVDLVVPDPLIGDRICRVSGIRKLAAGEPGARAGTRDR